MRVAFRADAGRMQGTGHVMRCLALAEALAARGVEMAFVCRPHPGHLMKLVKRYGVPSFALSPPSEVTTEPRTWLGDTQENDADETRAFLANWGSVDWLVVDHYAASQPWEEVVSEAVGRILVVDDLADRPHRCNALLDQTYHEDQHRYDALTPPDARLLLGPPYALLRREFAAARLLRMQVRSKRRVFAFFGGSDLSNQTTAVLHALEPWKRDVDVTAVLGPSNPHEPSVRQAAASFPYGRVLSGSSEMARLMASADVGFGAGGVSTLERMAVGLSSLVVTVADNQSGVTRRLAAEGYIRLLGSDSSVSVRAWSTAFEELDPPTLDEMSRRGMSLVDGLGAERVADYLCERSDR